MRTGAKFNAPKDAAVAMKQIIQKANAFAKQKEQAWVSMKFNLAAAIDEMPTDQFTATFMKNVAATKANLVRLSDIANELFDTLVAAEERIEDRKADKTPEPLDDSVPVKGKASKKKKAPKATHKAAKKKRKGRVGITK
jgi:hypothetical protein